MRLSPAQELWLYARVKQAENKRNRVLADHIRLICAFINPQMSKKLYSEKPTVTENTGFEEDLRKLDPNFSIDKYRDIIDGMAQDK